jgi:hypothetical protein
MIAGAMKGMELCQRRLSRWPTGGMALKGILMRYLLGCRMRDIRRLVCGAACVIAAQMAMAQDISPAETLLFQTNHLQQIHEPVELTYAYKAAGSVEPGFDDEVHVNVIKTNPDGSATASMRFLSGSRKLNIPDTGSSRGNPVVLGFLERDIAEMKRLTGGSANYFRKRIRLALAGAAQVRPVTFTYNGKQMEGQEVSAQPYVNDPLHERFEKYVNKKYVFIISKLVPGGVYKIRTSVPGGGSGTMPKDKTITEETLTLIRG